MKIVLRLRAFISLPFGILCYDGSQNNPRRRLSGFFDSYVNLRSNEDMKLEVGTENNVTDEKLRKSDLHVVKENEAAGMFFKPKHNCKILAPRTQKMRNRFVAHMQSAYTNPRHCNHANIDAKRRAKYLTHGGQLALRIVPAMLLLEDIAM